MSSERSKAADEIFCRSCGERIKQEAEICPHCGVQNEKASGPSPQEAGSSTSSATHDPSRYETTVSDTWWYGIAGGTALLAFLIIIISVIGDSLGAFGGLLTLIAWIALPVATYFDIQYIRANGKWNPNTVIWIILNAILFLNIITGAIYLYRRHEVLGKP